MRMTHPSRKYGPAWRARPSWITSEALVMGPGVPSVSGTFKTPEAPQGLPRGRELVLGLVWLGLRPAPPARGY